MQHPILRVERVQPDSAVPLGTCLELPPGDAIVGRDPACDLVLTDPRVSRRHARLRNDGGVSIEGLSRHALLVNGAPAEGVVRLAPYDWVQLGGVLTRYYPSTSTLTADPMTVEPALVTVSSPPEPVLALDLAACEARLGGVLLRLQPGPFAALRALAARPGAWVATDELAAAIWPDGDGNEAYVNKYVSYVRAAIVQTAAATPAVDRLVRANVAACADPWTEASRSEGSVDEAVREFVKGRKKVGFRLHLRAADVHVR